MLCVFNYPYLSDQNLIFYYEMKICTSGLIVSVAANIAVLVDRDSYKNRNLSSDVIQVADL